MLFLMIPGGSWGVPESKARRGWVVIWVVAGALLSYLGHRFLYLRTQIACYLIPKQISSKSLLPQPDAPDKQGPADLKTRFVLFLHGCSFKQDFFR